MFLVFLKKKKTRISLGKKILLCIDGSPVLLGPSPRTVIKIQYGGLTDMIDVKTHQSTCFTFCLQLLQSLTTISQTLQQGEQAQRIWIYL